MARMLPYPFAAMMPYLRQQTTKVFGFDGIWVPETYMPWWRAETVVLDDDNRKEDWYWYASGFPPIIWRTLSWTQSRK
jgi:hypothetical protein